MIYTLLSTTSNAHLEETGSHQWIQWLKSNDCTAWLDDVGKL